MGFSYFKGKSWIDLTREERLFCAELYCNYKSQPKALIDFLLRCPTMKGNVLCEQDLSNEWELGFEVCFYRDVCWYLYDQHKISFSEAEYSPKRTFDLCLFSEEKILIIEAKVQQPFKNDQLGDFEMDVASITKLLTAAGHKVPQVHVIALAASRYFENAAKFGAGIPSLFAQHYFTWNSLYQEIGDPIFKMAEERYKR